MLRVLAATATAFALLLAAASSASAATNITVVAGGGVVNNAGPPTFAPTGANSQVGADLINTQLTAGTSVTLDTSPDNSQPGTISIQAAISSGNSTATLTLDADDPITQTPGGTITFGGDTHLVTNTADDVTLTAANNFGSVSAGNVAGLTLNDTNALTLGAVSANAGLDVTAGGNVTQSAAAIVSGPTDFDVGATNDVTMNNASNVFNGVGFTSVNNANVVDSGVMTLNTSTVSGNFTVGAGGLLAQNGGTSIAAVGTTTLTAGSGNDITLTEAGNNFGTVAVVSGKNVSLTDANALSLGASTVSGSLGVNASGAISQTAALAITNATSLTAGSANDITLNNASNDFGGTVAVSSGKNVSLTDANALTVGSSTVSGNLTANAAGTVTQTVATTLAVTGTTLLTAGSANDITLTNTSNDFGGAVTVVSGKNVGLRDANALSLGASTVSANLSATTGGAITQAAALAVTGTTSLTAGSANDITLNNASNDFGGAVAVVSGKIVRLTDANALALGASTVSGALTVNADGAVTQTAATTLAVTGPTDATGSPVALSQATNDFTGPVQITSQGGGTATLADANDLSLGFSSTTDGPFTVTAGDDLAVPGGALVQATGALRLIADNVNPAAPGIGTGGITVGAGAALSGGDPIRLYAARRGDNSIAANATFNGATFTPGTIFVNSAREQWGFYSPAGSSTAPFTFFYKDTDASLPTANITKPASGATYEQGSVVNAAYTCADGGGGSGVVSCVGTVAVGSPIDTATLGQKTFKVDAQNGSGGQSTTTVSYTVVDTTKPTITLTSPADGANFTVDEHVVADYTCADTALVTCVGTIADGAALDTSAAGAKTFTVEATDGSGNTSTATATYTVGLPPGDCAVSLNGTDIADILTGTSAGDLINGLGGNDEITGEAGVDCLLGGDGNDVLRGNADADNLSGEGGNDELRGGPDDDDLRGQPGDDLLYGGDGADHLRGSGGTNTYYGRKGADVIRADNGIAEEIHCGPDKDTAYVDAGDKTFGCERVR